MNINQSSPTDSLPLSRRSVSETGAETTRISRLVCACVATTRGLPWQSACFVRPREIRAGDGLRQGSSYPGGGATCRAWGRKRDQWPAPRGFAASSVDKHLPRRGRGSHRGSRTALTLRRPRCPGPACLCTLCGDVRAPYPAASVRRRRRVYGTERGEQISLAKTTAVSTRCGSVRANAQQDVLAGDAQRNSRA